MTSKDLTVTQLATLSGVTVRALHYYDEIGLLSPAFVGANGYRYYGRKEQLRLQHILFHRELGVPLSAIGELLDLEGEDQIAVLQQHRKKLAAERERYRVLIETIDRTVEELRGEGSMANARLYEGFSSEKQAGYEAWLLQRYGEPMREGIERSRKSYGKMSRTEQEALGRELREVEAALAGALRDGLEPAAQEVDALIKRHRAWVAAMWGRPCSEDRYSGLADLYLSHPDFLARYEQIGTGFAEYLASAMKLHASKSGHRADARPAG